jgi:hypothetical protein
MVTATASAHDMLLTCDIARVQDSIVFSYGLTNQGGAVVFVMDADIAVDPGTQRRSADGAGATIWLAADGYAQVLKGVPALPEGVDPAERIMPVAVRLEPGKRLERRLVQPMPLVECSPYTPVGMLREYRLAPIRGVALNVDVLPANAAGLAVEARDIGRGWWRVAAEESVLLFARLACGFRANGLHMMVRTDDYPRPD